MTVVMVRGQRRAPGRTVGLGARLGLGLLALAAAVSGCTSQETAEPDAALPAPAPTPTATAAPAGTDGCPVDAATLFAALKANRSLFAAVDAQISGVREVACHRGYATATTVVPPEQADPAVIAFKYDPAATRWSAVAAGTDAVCTGLVPTDIVARLPGCINS